MNKYVIPLNHATIGNRLTVVKVRTEKNQELNRLKQLNIRPGSCLRILQLNKFEPLVIAVGDARIAINYNLAKSILVRSEC
ncbi:MAG: hypothetical protein CENE_03661 [Candidatus Celerinatantimonas neptuna]|nr:MAG: hypothetical protein CENE_03661 [Candidatus Celerinatantimonas neptuna]